MIKIDRGSKATGKEAIHVDPRTGRVYISEASFHSIKHKREDFIKAGNLLRTQELYVDPSIGKNEMLSKVLYKKSSDGKVTAFAEVYYSRLDEKYWVLRYSDRIAVEAGLMECGECGEPDVEIMYHVSACHSCGSCVVDCSTCMYEGYNENICNKCKQGSLYVPRSIE